MYKRQVFTGSQCIQVSPHPLGTILRRAWRRTDRPVSYTHLEANFLAQIYGSDHIAVQTAVTEIGTKSFHLAQRVIDTETQEIKCICTSIMVAFNLEKHESKPLEEEWIRAICKYEGRDLRKKK